MAQADVRSEEEPFAVRSAVREPSRHAPDQGTIDHSRIECHKAGDAAHREGLGGQYIIAPTSRMPTGHDTIPQRRPGVEWREFGRDAVLLDPASGAFLQINDTGTAVWKCADGHRTVDEIAQAVAETFNTVVGSVEDDVAAFIDELLRAGVLVRAGR